VTGGASARSVSAPPLVVVMGVSGCGKSSVAQPLAQALGVAYVEGDDWHPPENVARMRAGVPLTDADRQQWLERLADRLATAQAAGEGLVVSCSALRRSYRDLLRRGAPALRLLYLEGSPALLAERTSQRTGHFMPPALLASQLQTLEPPTEDERVLVQDVALTVPQIVHHALRWLGVPSPDLAR
jgi:gluconokinase